MASLKHSLDANGQSKYYIHWKDEKSGHGRRRIVKNIDDAAHLFWQKQNIELDCRTASWTGIDHSWTFRKLILFYLGYQAGKLEKNIIRLRMAALKAAAAIQNLWEGNYAIPT
ncbi:hypothetical protein CGN00_00745 [Salmonella enterica]|nr:hypothetical protein [Salmonella enterica]ECH9069003.1 hypothetical protein [Salmonella enterica subsp. enterica]EAM3112050.1 hypothetical protein [Salmonella enterica]EAM3234441.1 hypothetical protein [Salmonella enterica]EAS2276482.1 hypothetical protein [Salmonella enterica]